jgi:peptidoglycan/LPS O-acetylase OafA/YrhL
MFLSGALLALFMTGFWLYSLTDAILTPAPECRGLSKPTWIAVIAVTFIVGALAWLIVRRPVRDSVRPMPGWNHDRPGDQDDLVDEPWTIADDAAARHPAGRAMVTDPQAEPNGPDDDLDFLRVLDRAIHGNRQGGAEA